jgi:hypothetical protein
MYEFGITMLLGLALMTVVTLLVDYLPTIDRYRRAVTVLLAVGGAYLLDFSLFSGFGIGLREEWMGPVFTGLIVAGSTMVWSAVLGWLGHDEKHDAGTAKSRRPRIAA